MSTINILKKLIIAFCLFGFGVTIQAQKDTPNPIINATVRGNHAFQSLGIPIDSCYISKGTARIVNENNQTGQYMVWSDEFDGTSIDTSKWQFEIFGSCWDNVHWNTDSPNNARIVDGKLQIIARKDLAQTADEKAKACDGIHLYTSAYMVTQNKADWRFGRIEALIKLPNVGQGFVPAFWMKPASEMYGWWPYSGSIEIMEHPTNQVVNIYGTIDSKEYSFLGIGYPETYSIQIPDAETEFHTYAIEWNENQIEFYVDENKYFTYLNQHLGFETWPLDQPFYIILDISVGGGWVGNPDENTVFPAVMEVEYVRVYQKLEDIHISGKDNVTPGSMGISYSVPLLGDASYSWTITPGAQIVSGQVSNQIMVDWGDTNGNVGVVITTDSSSQTLDYPVEVTNNMFKNAGFEKGSQYWNSNIVTFGKLNQPRGSFEFISPPNSHTNSSIKINVPELMNYSYDFQITQTGFELKNQTKYDVRFWAKSDVNGNKISAAIVIPGNLGKANYVIYIKEFVLTDQWAQYTFSFTANENAVGGLNIDMGYQIGSYFLDDFYLDRHDHTTGLEVTMDAGNPEHYSVSQNYPNPCSSVTSITFSLPGQQMVTLKVYNVQGNEIAVIMNEVKRQGNYTVTFNLDELVDGMYFYKFIAGHYIKTRKFFVMR
jgi:beta-glucanase (GH16 family)